MTPSTSERKPIPAGGRRAFFAELLASIAERGRRLVRPGPKALPRAAASTTEPNASNLLDTLLSNRGEASRVALAEEILGRWKTLDDEGRCAFLLDLLDRFGPDPIRLDAAIAAYQAEPNDWTMVDLHAAAEPRRQELLRRLNLAPQGTASLVAMREVLLRRVKSVPRLGALDADFVHLFSSWFNRGFLVLRQIDWNTPASILEKIIRYEAVHEIRDWDDLRRRLQPEDRRCFAFFHPALVDEPLIFVEVALAPAIPQTIAGLLAERRTPPAEETATTAVFYSISNCQAGLRGISFGDFLIKQVVEELKREAPGLTTFVTLSPVPGFAAWLDRERADPAGVRLTEDDKAALADLDVPGWWASAERAEAIRPALLRAAAQYFLASGSMPGRHVDPVARFHLGNGARLERLNFAGDPSERGLRESYGLMVNYLYKPDEIETNHERFVGRGEIAAATSILDLIAATPAAPPLRPAKARPRRARSRA
jgi:malonyl-CoA decarboxylase